MRVEPENPQKRVETKAKNEEVVKTIPDKLKKPLKQDSVIEKE